MELQYCNFEVLSLTSTCLLLADSSAGALWYWASGATPTPNTGPENDNTIGTSGMKIIYYL